ncbi:MAG: LysM domain-containing protein [Polyangiaceae bacterium]
MADWFDKQRVDNGKFLDNYFTKNLEEAIKRDDSPNATWRDHLNFYCACGNAGVSTALFQFSSSVASGFIDTLRIGDGVKEGGWGYAKDALRLLVLAGPALRLARLGIATFVAVDAATDAEICTWVSSSKALTMTGTQHYATVEQLATAAGMGSIPPAQLPAVYLGQLAPVMTSMGADVTAVGASGAGSVDEVLTAVVKANPNAVAPFSVQWQLGAGASNEFGAVAPNTTVGHTMVAFRSMATGGLRIMDRTGKIYSSIADLDGTIPGKYPGISSAKFYNQIDTLLVMKNATIVTTLENGSPVASALQAGSAWLKTDDGSIVFDPTWLQKSIGLEVRSLPFRVEKRRSVNVPGRVAAAKGKVVTQTVCVPSSNSDTPLAQTCTTTKEYDVQQGDTLQSIAQLAYGDANRWRGIAAVNGIKNPDSIQAGMRLVIP